MDTTEQVYETDATGWQRGLYDDIKETFRAPFVNWIFRTTMANRPEFLRYLWAQAKPAFQTRAFGRFTVRYRDAILSAVEEHRDLPRYRREEVTLPPAEYRELRGQLATFDVVAPRLAVLFELADRRLHDEPVGEAFASERAATAPLPNWLDRDRGVAPTMGSADDLDGDAAATVSEIRGFHGFDDSLPSIYRCLVQWPSFLTAAWSELEQSLESDAFEDACDRADDLTAEFVADLPYDPRLTPDDLERRGMDEDAIEDVQGLFRQFSRGPVETVLPAIPLYAEAVDAAGRREWY